MPRGIQKKKEEDKRPFYPIGTVLVTKVFNGRDTWVNFYRVVGHTKTKAPKVIMLDKIETDRHSDCYGVKSKLCPNLEEEETRGGLITNMRWYKSQEQYLTQEDHYHSKYSSQCASTEVYDKDKVSHYEYDSPNI